MGKLTIVASGGKGFDRGAQQAVKEALAGQKLTWTLKDHYLTADNLIAEPNKIDDKLAKFLVDAAPPLADAAKIVIKSGKLESVDDYPVSFVTDDEKPFAFTLIVAAPKGPLSKRWKSSADKAKANFELMLDPFLLQEPAPALLSIRRFAVEVEMSLDMRPEKSHQQSVIKAVEKALAPQQKRAQDIVSELEKSYEVALKKCKSDPSGLKDAEKWLTIANRKLAQVYNGVQAIAQKTGEDEVAALAKKTPRLSAASFNASVVVNFSKLEMGEEIEPLAGLGDEEDGEKSKAAAEALNDKAETIAEGVKDGVKEHRKFTQILEGLITAFIKVEDAQDDVKDDDDVDTTEDDEKDAKALGKAKQQQEKMLGLARSAVSSYQSLVKEMVDGARQTRTAIENLSKVSKKENFATEDMRNAVKKAQTSLKTMRKDAAQLYVAFNKIGAKLQRLAKMVDKPDKNFKITEAEKIYKDLSSPKPFQDAADLNKSVAALSKLLDVK